MFDFFALVLLLLFVVAAVVVGVGMCEIVISCIGWLLFTPRRRDFLDLAADAAEWSQATFGPDAERGPMGPLRHLEKEAREAQEHPSDESDMRTASSSSWTHTDAPVEHVRGDS